jgi:hypothetical protein
MLSAEVLATPVVLAFRTPVQEEAEEYKSMSADISTFILSSENMAGSV